jgi:biotin carboxyl carrier protein
MTGSIIEVVRGIGETVEAGDVVLVIESMKMNNELRAPAAGEIIEIPVKAGERVAAGALLATIRA